MSPLRMSAGLFLCLEGETMKNSTTENFTQNIQGVQLDTDHATDQPDMVASDIIAAETHDGLPATITDMIASYIEQWCARDHITDMKKERQITWKALCMELGMALFKKSKLLHDVTKEKTRGGIWYDYNKLAALCDYWGALCYRYNKAPMIDDFARFAGISDTMLYNAGGNYPNLEDSTPARTVLLKKLHSMQERGLAGLIVDGRQNPTGALAALNHWHGWTTTKEIIHTTSGGGQNAVALPVFGQNAPELPEKSTD